MAPTKRPAFQWYPGDAQRDTALRACCLEARGLWREMMDLMHDGTPYGHLTAGGVPIEPDVLAGMIGIPAKRCAALLAELEARGVYSRNAAGVIYSRRMVRDEHNRTVRAKGGPKSLDNPNVPRPKDEGKDGDKDTFAASFGGSPATASTASAFAETPVQVADARIRFCAAANKGLAEHPRRPQPIPKVLPNSGYSVQATDIILATGMPIDFAEAEIYRLASSHNAEDWITSLNYFVGGVGRAWQQQQAALDRNASRPRRSTSQRQQNPGAQQVANIKTFLTGTHD